MRFGSWHLKTLALGAWFAIVFISVHPAFAAESFTSNSVVPAIGVLENWNPRFLGPSLTCSTGELLDFARLACARSICGSELPDADTRCMDQDAAIPNDQMLQARAIITKRVEQALVLFEKQIHSTREFRAEQLTPEVRAVFGMKLAMHSFDPQAVSDMGQMYGKLAVQKIQAAGIQNPAFVSIFDSDVSYAFSLEPVRYWSWVGNRTENYSVSREEALKNYQTAVRSLMADLPNIRRDTMESVMLSSNSLNFVATLNLKKPPTEDEMKRVQLIQAALRLVRNVKANPSAMKSVVGLINPDPKAKANDFNSGLPLAFLHLTAESMDETYRVEKEYIKKNVIIGCLNSYEDSVKRALKQSCIVEFKAKAEDVRAQVLKTLKSIVPEGDAKKIDDLVSKETISLPLDRAQIHKKFLDSIDDDFRNAERSEDNHTQDIADLLSSMNAPYLKQILDDCRNHIPPIDFTDSYWSMSGKVKVSLVSVLTPMFEGVLSHELGHTWSTAARKSSLSEVAKKKLEKIRDCLANQHRRADRNVGALDASTTFEEDFADLVSGNAAPSDYNSGCEFMSEISSSDDLSFSNANKSETHSAGFFRLLHLEFLSKGKLPAACASLPQMHPQPVFENCLK